jgi:hypothetical protein
MNVEFRCEGKVTVCGELETCNYGALWPMLNRKRGKVTFKLECPHCGKQYLPEQVNKMLRKAEATYGCVVDTETITGVGYPKPPWFLNYTSDPDPLGNMLKVYAKGDCLITMDYSELEKRVLAERNLELKKEEDE